MQGNCLTIALVIRRYMYTVNEIIGILITPECSRANLGL